MFWTKNLFLLWEQYKTTLKMQFASEFQKLETGEQRQYLGTGSIRKQIFYYMGTVEQAHLFQGNKETGIPSPWEGLNI